MQIAELWVSTDPKAWERALERHWDFIKPQFFALAWWLDRLDLEMLREMDARAWYYFLRDEYFRWKYTARYRYAKTTRLLKTYLDKGRLSELDEIRDDLLMLDPSDVRTALAIAERIHGLGTAGASGLLALMYPQSFGMVDQFAVKALREVPALPEVAALNRMNPESLTTKDGVVLIEIYRRKAGELNRMFQAAVWTPRKIDKVLWTYGRPSNQEDVRGE